MVRFKVKAYIALVLVIFSLFTISPWYLFNNEPYYLVEEEKITLNDLEAEKLAKYYDPEKFYYKLTKTQYLVTKSKIPFIRKKTEIKVLSNDIYSRLKR